MLRKKDQQSTGAEPLAPTDLVTINGLATVTLWEIATLGRA